MARGSQGIAPNSELPLQVGLLQSLVWGLQGSVEGQDLGCHHSLEQAPTGNCEAESQAWSVSDAERLQTSKVSSPSLRQFTSALFLSSSFLPRRIKLGNSPGQVPLHFLPYPLQTSGPSWVETSRESYLESRRELAAGPDQWCRR